MPSLRAITGADKPSALIVSSSSSLLVSSARRRARGSLHTSCGLGSPTCAYAAALDNSDGSWARKAALSRRASKVPSSTWCLYRLVSYAVIPTIRVRGARARIFEARSTPDVPFSAISTSTTSRGRTGSVHMRSIAVGKVVTADSARRCAESQDSFTIVAMSSSAHGSLSKMPIRNTCLFIPAPAISPRARPSAHNPAAPRRYTPGADGRSSSSGRRASRGTGRSSRGCAPRRTAA